MYQLPGPQSPRTSPTEPQHDVDPVSLPHCSATLPLLSYHCAGRGRGGPRAASSCCARYHSMPHCYITPRLTAQGVGVAGQLPGPLEPPYDVLPMPPPGSVGSTRARLGTAAAALAVAATKQHPAPPASRPTEETAPTQLGYGRAARAPSAVAAVAQRRAGPTARAVGTAGHSPSPQPTAGEAGAPHVPAPAAPPVSIQHTVAARREGDLGTQP